MSNDSRPRLRDIAARAGVSISTVSLVINDKPGVSDETRREVRSLLTEFGYRSSRRKTVDRSRTILFAVYDRSEIVASHNPFFNAVLRGVEREARRNGYGLTVTYVREGALLDAFIASIAESPPGGVLIDASVMEDPTMRRVLEYREGPLVAMDNYFPDIPVDTVAIDNHGGARAAVQYLIRMGHARIGTVGSSIATRNFDERRNAFLETLAQAELRANPAWQYAVRPAQDAAYTDMTAALTRGIDLPDALFCQNDLIAFGVIRALKEHGVRVPGDVSIVAFDDLPFCDVLEPRLSTVHVHIERMAAIAVKRMIERIDAGAEEFTKTRIGTEFIPRDSVKPPNI